jgi:hypothetical protein
MFTWICPQCGREVPPAYTECPDCAAKTAGGGAPLPPQPPAPQPFPPQPMAPQPTQAGMPVPQQPYPPYPQQPQYPPYPPPPYQQPGQPAYQQPVYQQPQYQQPVYQQPQYQPQYAPPPPPPPPPPPTPTAPAPEIVPPVHSAPPQSSLFGTPEPLPQRSGAGGIPTWLLTIFCTAGFVALVAGVYWLVGRSHSPTPSTSVESPAAKPGAATNPWQKFIEVSGLRFVEDPKHKGKVFAKCLVTNHSSGDLSGLAGNVTIWASTKKSDEDAQGTFSFITNLSAYESKEITAPLTTKFKIYELPDWQNMTTDLQITAPAAAGSGGLP